MMRRLLQFAAAVGLSGAFGTVFAAVLFDGRKTISVSPPVAAAMLAMFFLVVFVSAFKD